MEPVQHSVQQLRTSEADAAGLMLGAGMLSVRPGLSVVLTMDRLAWILRTAGDLLDIGSGKLGGDEEAGRALTAGAGVLVGVAEALASAVLGGLAELQEETEVAP